MPKKGFATITVKSVIYDILHDEYEKKSVDLLFQGITTFSGYVVYILSSHLSNEKLAVKCKTCKEFVKSSWDKCPHCGEKID